MRKIYFRKKIVIGMVILMAFLISPASAQNEPPFVEVNVFPTEGYIGDIFSIYVTLSDPDGYLIKAEATLNGKDISSGFDRLNSTTGLYDYASSTAGNYTVVCKATDNSGYTTTGTATFSVKEEEPSYVIRPITLDDDLPKYTGFEDFDFFANLNGSDGKNYFIELSMVYHLGVSHLKLDNEPASVYFNGTHNIIEENPFWDTKISGPIIVQEFADSVVYTLTQGSIETKFTFKPPDLHIARFTSGSDYIELNFHTRGLPYWYNPLYTDDCGVQRGYEIFCNVESLLFRNGKTVALNGYGVFEHWYPDRCDWKTTEHSDWLCFNFDEIYGLVFGMDDYRDGGIYLIREEQYVVTNSFSVEYLEVAYSHSTVVPTKISVVATTEVGTIEFVGDAQIFQHVIGEYDPWFNVGDIRLNGTFTYVNGTTIILTNGSGWDMAISPAWGVPPLTHTLDVYSFPVSGVPFTLDGVSYITPYHAALEEGIYTVTMPPTVTIGETPYNFVEWEDGSTNPTRTISLTADTTITAYYESAPPPDTIPPTITFTRHEPTNPTTNDVITIYTTVTDNVDSGNDLSVVLYLSYKNGPWMTLTLSYMGDNNFEVSGGPVPPGDFRYYITAIDQSGNIAIDDNNGDYYSFTVLSP